MPSFGRGPLTLDMIKDLERMDADERARGADGAKIVAPTLPTGANQGGKKRGG